MAVIFGGVFLYPLVVVFLEISRRGSQRQVAGVAATGDHRSWWLVAAVITPSSDPFSFVAMAVPLLVFYEAVDPARTAPPQVVQGRPVHRRPRDGVG